MKDHRQGNDLKVIWSLKTKGQDFFLADKDVSLFLKNTYLKTPIIDFTLKGNKIEWTFRGKDQKHLGVHSLELVVNNGKDGMITTDACNFVNLVNCSCKTGGAPESNVEIQSIELTSNLQFGYDDTEIREELAKLHVEMQRMYEKLKAMIQGGATTPPYAVLDNAILDQVILL